MFLVNLRRIRFIFKKPLHNNILLYDGISKSKMDSISKKYAVFYNRYEEINLYDNFKCNLKIFYHFFFLY